LAICNIKAGHHFLKAPLQVFNASSQAIYQYLQKVKAPLQEFFHFFTGCSGAFAGFLPVFAGVYPVFAEGSAMKDALRQEPELPSSKATFAAGGLGERIFIALPKCTQKHTM
jgi:hypothetical protein